MSEKRRGLGRGLGALIPSSAGANGTGNGAAVSRPVDLFFPEGRRKTVEPETAADASEAEESAPPIGAVTKSTTAPDSVAKATSPSRKPAAAKSFTRATEAAATSNKSGSSSA